MMKIGKNTIEKLAWWIVFLVLILNVATYTKLTVDDNRKFRILRHNQDTLICVVKGFNNPINYQQHIDFIDNCVRTNQ